MKTSIVIPIYNNFGLINELLLNLHKHTKADEILVVDDYSSDPKTLTGINWWAMNFNVKVYRPIENLGFLKASNYGMSKATGDVLILLSSDVLVETDLVKEVGKVLREKPNALVGGVVYQDSTGWNQFGNQIFPYAEGWLLACYKDGWEALGGFDERYAPHDFEDVDLSTTALHTGFVLHALNDPRIRHLGAQTIGYTETRRELTERNRKKFEEKWITIPSAQKSPS